MSNFDKNFEAARLAMLAKQHSDIVKVTGEVVFCAEDDEDRLSGTSWTLEEDIFDQVTESGFKLHLIELLDDFIAHRGQCNGNVLPKKEGIVRFGGGDLSIEWLPGRLNSPFQRRHVMEALLDEYGRILKELKFDSFNHNEDKYSGVFLPVPFDEYWSSSLKVMLVGRETAGWNTDNQKNTIKRVAEFAENNLNP